MILIFLRIIFGLALAFGFKKVLENAQAAPETGDLTNAFYLAVCVILAVANAAVWAPYVGNLLSQPLTGTITKSTYTDPRNYLLKFVRWLDGRGLRRLTLLFCFLEGIHRPTQPAAFVVGLKNARPGSWLEKVFAREVFHFDNAQHCLEAYEALKRHGIDARPHHNPEINMVLLSIEHEVKPAPEQIPVPRAVWAPPLKRDRRIRLFEAAMPESVAKERKVDPGVDRENPEAPLSDSPERAGEHSFGAETATAENDAPAPGVFSRIKAFLLGG